MESSLRRYTELPFLIDYLQSKELVLLSPSYWDDRNDSYFIEQFAKASGLNSVYALCLTQGPETYHHWRIFSHGSGGACLEFDRDILLKFLPKLAGFRAETVLYKTIDQLRSRAPLLSELPFLKRFAFADEEEFRLFYATNENHGPIYRIPIPIKAIRRITLSPWLTESVVKQVKKTLKSIEGCSGLKVYRSTLVENENWKRMSQKAK